MHDFWTCLFSNIGFFHDEQKYGQSKTCIPEDVSCLKQGRIGHDAFDAVSKLWNEPLPLDPTEDFEEALKNEIII